MGHQVLGLDTDPATIRTLRAGRAPFDEPGLHEVIACHTRTGRLRFTGSYEEMVNFADLHFLCVGTPQRTGSLAIDLTDLEVRLACSPDFLCESTSLADIRRPSRTILGVEPGDDRTEELLRDAWKPPNGSRPASTSSTCVAALCEAGGGNVTTLAHTLALDPRVGTYGLAPGLGYGGSCLPKDVRKLIARAEELGIGPDLRLLTQVDAVNRARRRRLIELAKRASDGHWAGRRSPYGDFPSNRTSTTSATLQPWPWRSRSSRKAPSSPPTTPWPCQSSGHTTQSSSAHPEPPTQSRGPACSSASHLGQNLPRSTRPRFASWSTYPASSTHGPHSQAKRGSTQGGYQALGK
jgi:UDP-glucose 6-dehydrogenase